MKTDIPDYQEMDLPRPEYDDVAARYREIEEDVEAAETPAEVLQLVRAWDDLRKELKTWRSLTNLRFRQDTSNPGYKAEREYADDLQPKITDLDTRMKRRFLNTHRGALVESVGEQALELWEADITTFEPAIEDDLAQESRLKADYTELKASARIDFRGETLTLSTIGKYNSDADRETRHEAQTKMWAWYADNAEKFDRIYDDLVELRTGMAKELGFDDFIGLGYKQMQRIDYDQDDVEVFRQEVVDRVVPLAEKLREQQAERLGVDELKYWDEAVFDPQGNPRPQGEHDELVQKAQEMFDAMGPELGEFFQVMVQKRLLDLDSRDDKAGGGFCTSFPEYGVPFVFANFNGTKHDVEVLTHEMGHAFQNWASRDKEPMDYRWPTLESCEIHSMSLEFLAWPYLEPFFGEEDTERFYEIHLAESLLFLPYGCAVDHFQHLVYANPDATPDERHEMWQQMEERYLPWRDYGDLDYPSRGAFWQKQSHIYSVPFYYIDYVLAMTCALQFWDRMQSDYDRAMRDYVELCRRGGEAPFQELATSAGLTSPFEEGCLESVVARAEKSLGVD